jgi:HEAT repeat protein
VTAMLNEYDKAALAKIDSRHFAELVKLVEATDTTLRYGAAVNMDQYAAAAFALSDLGKPENVDLIRKTLQDQHRQAKHIREEYEKANDRLMSWLRSASQWLVHRDEVPKVAAVETKEAANG